jgi:hypothetical protein
MARLMMHATDKFSTAKGLIADIKVKIPHNLTARQKELFQELKRS